PQEAFTLTVEQREKAIQAIKQAFADAKAYYIAKKAAAKSKSSATGSAGAKPEGAEGATGSASEKPQGSASAKPLSDTRGEAMIPLFERRVPLVIHADDISQIQPAVAFAAKENLKMILLGGYDALRCAELLKKHDVPV